MNGADVTQRILIRARAFGASSAGVTSLSLLQGSPSYQKTGGRIRAEGARSVLVISMRHEANESELDWWARVPGSTRGNRRLIEIAADLTQWLKDEFGMVARLAPYQIESGGIFLKDAAALAGLGVIGKNNLLVTPEFGPRVRLRSLLLDAELTPTAPVDFSPCRECNEPCRKACPKHAFEQESNAEYHRVLCDKQMVKDESNALVVEKWADDGSPAAVVKYCRACELSCPARERL